MAWEVGGAFRSLGKFEWAKEEILSADRCQELETEENWRPLVRKEVQAQRVGVKLTWVKSRWDEGLIGMCPGDKRKLTIPPEFGYGDRDVGPIKGGSTLSMSASPCLWGLSIYYQIVH